MVTEPPPSAARRLLRELEGTKQGEFEAVLRAQQYSRNLKEMVRFTIENWGLVTIYHSKVGRFGSNMENWGLVIVSHSKAAQQYSRNLKEMVRLWHGAVLPPYTTPV